jgi:predicted permease
LLGGVVVGASSRWLFRQPPKVFASYFQCAFRFNSYIGLAVVGKMFGAPGIAAMGLLLGALVPLANMVAVSALARHGEHSVWRELARNPLILATASGLMLNLAEVPIPEPVVHLLVRLADAALAMGLMAVGAALRLRQAQVAIGAGVFITTTKLLVMPILAWMAARTLGLSDMLVKVVVIFAALPTASSAYILAVRMGGDGQAVAWLISVSTLVSMVSLSVWIALLGQWLH